MQRHKLVDTRVTEDRGICYVTACGEVIPHQDIPARLVYTTAKDVTCQRCLDILTLVDKTPRLCVICDKPLTKFQKSYCCREHFRKGQEREDWRKNGTRRTN